MLTALFAILVFPGFLFLCFAGMIYEFADRKLYARFQNRMGPPWFQPLADFIKLVSKEDIIPEEAEPRIFKVLPAVALSSVLPAIFYIPLWSVKPLFSFSGDAIVVIYLLTIPTLTFFLAGWYSASLYSIIGSVRTLTQLFAYEVPLFMSILAPALLAGSWTLSEISAFYLQHPLYCLVNIPAFIVAVIAAQGKLERVPFDAPEAETEIVAGAFTEYSGRLLAMFRMTLDIELVIVSALLASVFLPFGLNLDPYTGFVLFLLKLFVIVFILSAFRAVLARLRIDQMVEFCWKYLAPLALLQIAINLFINRGL